MYHFRFAWMFCFSMRALVKHEKQNYPARWSGLQE